MAKKKDEGNDELLESLRSLLGTATQDKVEKFVSTGSTLLDYAIANRKGGGVPMGRIIEISGNEGSGKSLIAYHVLANCQKMGGLAIYIDTERSANKEFMERMGINYGKLYQPKPIPSTIEDVFTFVEKTISIARTKGFDKTKPVVVVWDSVAATHGAGENEVDQNDSPGMGLEARAMSRGFRKIISALDEGYITFICINQLREKIGSFGWGDNETTPHGKALPFYSSVRIKLKSKGQIKNTKTEETVGVDTMARVFKNKVGPNHRDVEFPLYYDWGINNEISLMEFLLDKEVIVNKDPDDKEKKDEKKAKPKNKAEKDLEKKEKKSAFKYLKIDELTPAYKWKSTNEWVTILKDQKVRDFVLAKIDELMIRSFETRPDDIDKIDTEDLMEMEQLKQDLKDKGN
jgi:recombination protein RecA